MSWSVNATGKKADVEASIKEQFSRLEKYSALDKGEGELAQKAGELLAAVLADQTDNTSTSVSANGGSHSMNDHANHQARGHSISINVTFTGFAY